MNARKITLSKALISAGTNQRSTAGKGSENEAVLPTNQAEEVRSKAEQLADPAAETEKSAASPSQSNAKRPSFNPSGPDNPNPSIIQISLSGPDPKAGWLSNKTTRRLEAPSPNWTPSQPSAPYSYHGAAIGADPTKAQSVSVMA